MSRTRAVARGSPANVCALGCKCVSSATGRLPASREIAQPLSRSATRCVSCDGIGGTCQLRLQTPRSRQLKRSHMQRVRSAKRTRACYRLGETGACRGGFTVVYLPTPEDTLSFCVVYPLGQVVDALRTESRTARRTPAFRRRSTGPPDRVAESGSYRPRHGCHYSASKARLDPLPCARTWAAPEALPFPRHWPHLLDRGSVTHQHWYGRRAGSLFRRKPGSFFLQDEKDSGWECRPPRVVVRHDG
jgi:hypothetical protein